MQRTYQKHFTKRANFYTSLLTSHSGTPGESDYNVPEIHFVGIMNFPFRSAKNCEPIVTGRFLHDCEPIDKISNTQLRYYLQFPKFKLKPHQLKTDLERWMYLFKNMASLKENPVFLTQPIFQKFLAIADISSLSKSELKMYKKSLFQKQNEYASLESAREESREEGRLEGRVEGKIEIVKSLLASGALSISKISKILGLDVDYIKKIAASIPSNEA